MLDYINAQIFGQGKGMASLDKLDKILDDFQSDNKRLQQEIGEYDTKIQKLPAEIRKRIIQQQQEYQRQRQRQQIQEQKQQYPEKGSPKLQNTQENELNIYSNIHPTTKRDKKSLQQRLFRLQQQQAQINYITQLTDAYIRCKKQYQQDARSMGEQQQTNEEYHSMREKLNHQRLVTEQEEMEKISQFISNLQPYYSDRYSHGNSTQKVNQIVQQIKLHTGKKLIEKCQNLIHHELIGGYQNIVIESYLLKNCRSIILGSVDDGQHNEKNIKIINKFIEKILSNVIYYDVTYQKIILLEVKSQDKNSGNKHQDAIKRQKLSFAPNQTDKYFENLKFTVKYHVQKVQNLRNILFEDSQQHLQKSGLIKEFDKIVERSLSTIKSTLEYILPYLNIKSRKDLMSILTHGKDEIIQFEDLVLRLKFKGQDGEMFMNNLDAVFNRLFEIKQNKQENKQKVIFNDGNFDILTSFFQLGISQAEQSLLQSSSKAIMKFTTNLSRKIHEKAGEKFSTKHNSKKIFNMIFFSVSNLIQRFDTFLDQKNQLFSAFDEDLQQTYQQKVSQWTMRLIEIRERVRVKIHQE